jgi:hypothetical protein
MEDVSQDQAYYEESGIEMKYNPTYTQENDLGHQGFFSEEYESGFEENIGGGFYESSAETLTISTDTFPQNPHLRKRETHEQVKEILEEFDKSEKKLEEKNNQVSFLTRMRNKFRIFVESKFSPKVSQAMGGSKFKGGLKIEMKSIVRFCEILILGLLLCIVVASVLYFFWWTKVPQSKPPTYQISPYKSWTSYVSRTTSCTSADKILKDVWLTKGEFCSGVYCTKLCEIEKWLEKCVNYTEKNFAVSTFAERPYPCAMYLKLENGTSVFLLDPKLIEVDRSRLIKAPHSCDFVGLPLETSTFPWKITVEILNHHKGKIERKIFTKTDVVLFTKVLEIMNRKIK